MALCSGGMETALLGTAGSLFPPCWSSLCLETGSHTSLQLEYSLLGAPTRGSQALDLLPHVPRALCPSPRSWPRGSACAFSCRPGQKGSYKGQETQEQPWGSHGRAPLGPFPWCRDQESIPWVLVEGVPNLTATGTAAAGSSGKSRLWGGQGWGEPQWELPAGCGSDVQEVLSAKLDLQWNTICRPQPHHLPWQPGEASEPV